MISSYLYHFVLEKDLAFSGYHRFEEPKGLIHFTLVDQNLNEITAGDFKGQWTAIFFGFTHCPDICPTTMSKLNNSVKTLPNPPRVVMVTADPERDTPEVLREYLQAFNETFHGLTGSVENLTALAGQLGFAFRKIPGPVLGTYSIQHSDSIAVINPEGEYVGLLNLTREPEDITKVFESFL